MAMHLKFESLSYHKGALRCLHPCSSGCIILGYLSAFQKAINCHFWLTLKHCIPFLNRKISFMLVFMILSVLFQKMYSIFWMYGFLSGKGSKKKKLFLTQTIPLYSLFRQVSDVQCYTFLSKEGVCSSITFYNTLFKIIPIFILIIYIPTFSLENNYFWTS